MSKWITGKPNVTPSRIGPGRTAAAMTKLEHLAGVLIVGGLIIGIIRAEISAFMFAVAIMLIVKENKETIFK